MGLKSKFSNDHDIIMKNVLHHQAPFPEYGVLSRDFTLYLTFPQADENIIFVFPWQSTYQQNPPRKARRSPKTPQ